MKYILILLLACVAFQKNTGPFDFSAKCISSANGVINSAAEALDSFNKNKVEAGIDKAGDILVFIPDFLNNCISPKTFPWDVKVCIQSIEDFGKNIYKLTQAVGNRKGDSVLQAVINLVDSFPKLTSKCLKINIPIELGKCLADFFNLTSAIGNAIDKTSSSRYSFDEKVKEITKSIDAIIPLAKDCFHVNIPLDSTKCMNEIIKAGKSVIDILEKALKNNTPINTIFEELAKILKEIPNAAKKCIKQKFKKIVAVKMSHFMESATKLALAKREMEI